MSKNKSAKTKNDVGALHGTLGERSTPRVSHLISANFFNEILK